MSKFLIFFQIGTSSSGLTKRWAVHNTGREVLGYISWYAPWRRYWYTGLPSVGLDATCLREIADFCEHETLEHKNA